MNDLLFWLYLVNGTLLIVHEIDSAYWKEWELFGMGGGPGLFMLLHFPMVGIIMYGLIEARGATFAGLLLSLVLSAAGVGAFFIHGYFLRRGRREFSTPVSLFILYSIFAVSLAQAGAASYLLAIR